jgi:hypothetical protein
MKKLIFIAMLAACALSSAQTFPVNNPSRSGSVNITGGSIDNTAIGATTQSTGAFTMITLGGTTTTGIFTGEIGLPNNAALRWRNAAGSAYRNAIYVDTSDNLQLGGGGATNNTVIGVAGLGTVATFSATGLAITGKVSATTTLSTGAASLTLTTGAVGLSKMTASGSAPGAGGAKLELVCGTNAGTAKLIIAAGTSATAVTVVDNIGAGVTGC